MAGVVATRFILTGLFLVKYNVWHDQKFESYEKNSFHTNKRGAIAPLFVMVIVPIRRFLIPHLEANPHYLLLWLNNNRQNEWFCIFGT